MTRNLQYLITIAVTTKLSHKTCVTVSKSIPAIVAHTFWRKHSNDSDRFFFFLANFREFNVEENYWDL